MNDDTLRKLGFKEYPPTVFHPKGVEKFFQKKYTDEKGIKYFIDVQKWPEYRIPGRDFIPVAYEYTIQIRDRKGNAIDLLFHDSWKLEDVERYVEKLFKLRMFTYYERY